MLSPPPPPTEGPLTVEELQLATRNKGMPLEAPRYPPGFPDFLSRRRIDERGEVVRVEVSCDGGWRDATLGAPIGEHAWRGWSFRWNAEPGEHELRCRATDAAGDVQPIDARWNYQGMGNNHAQVVAVTVR